MLTDPLHLAATSDFINENPSVITPVRYVKTPTGTGGFTNVVSGDLVAPITVRKIGISMPTAIMAATSADGKAIMIDAYVVAMPDADIQAGDEFDIGPNHFKVDSISLDPPWRLRAEVFNRG